MKSDFLSCHQETCRCRQLLWLALLEQDIANHPERLQPISAELVEQLQDLVGGIEVDLEAALPDDA